MSDSESFIINNIDDLEFVDGTSIYVGHSLIVFSDKLFHVHDRKYECLSDTFEALFIKAAFYPVPNGHYFEISGKEIPQIREPYSDKFIPLVDFAAVQARNEMRRSPVRLIEAHIA